MTVDNTAQVQAELNKRNADIKAVFAQFGTAHNDLLVECLGDLSITAEQAKDKLLAKLGCSRSRILGNITAKSENLENPPFPILSEF